MSFAHERTIKAVRKDHHCDGCGGRIGVGEPAVRWAGLTEGDFGTAIYHPDCRQAEVDLNNDILGWMYGDDWCALSDIDSDDWPWLREAFPSVATRMGLLPPETPTPAAGQESPVGCAAVQSASPTQRYEPIEDARSLLSEAKGEGER